MPQKIILGLDIGGTSLKLGAWDVDDHALGERQFWAEGIKVSGKLDGEADPEPVCDAIAALIRTHAAVLGDPPTALGIGSAGLIADGVILQSPNTPWDYLPLEQPLAQRLGYPVTLINDADAFLLGALSGSGDGSSPSELGDVSSPLPRCVIGITLGTGIGTAVWLNGALLAGGSGISPEAGHVTLDLYGEPANTGIPGSWESLAGKDALLACYEERGGPRVAEAADVAHAAELEEEDGPARSTWRRYGHVVGAGLGSLCNIFSPQLILIGGGLAGAERWFKAELFRALVLHKLRAMPPPEVRFVADAPDTVAKGGACAALLRR